MFYTYIEKSKSWFNDAGELRQLAFDCNTRHMYYSEPIPSELRQRCFINGAATEGCEPPQLTYLKKFKVYGFSILAAKYRNHCGGWTEEDYYQIEMDCDLREAATGEYPPCGPCLCPSVEPVRPAFRRPRPDVPEEAEAAEDDARDPFGLYELYDAGRHIFRELKAQKTELRRRAARDGAHAPRFDGKYTVASPLKKDVFGSRAQRFTFRCRNERDFVRLRHVLHLVLGYDGFRSMPYEGYLPYDPRNGVVFGQIPMNVYPTFAKLDKTVFYTFIQGDLLGCADGQKLSTVVSDAYCVVTHDTIYFMLKNKHIPRWVRLADVEQLSFNAACDQPFFALLSEDPAPDFIFVPRQPVFNGYPVKTYDAGLEVRRVAVVLHDICCCSVVPQRVTHIEKVHDLSPEAFWRRMSSGARPLVLHPRPGFDRDVPCSLPRERLSAIWQRVRELREERGSLNPANVAVPIYAETTHQLALSNEQIGRVEAVLDDMRERLDDITGLPVDAVLRLTTENGENSNQHVDPAAESSIPDNLPAPRNREASAYSANSVVNVPSAQASTYQMPNTRYFSHSEVEGGLYPADLILIQEHHELMPKTPMVRRNKSVGCFDDAVEDFSPQMSVCLVDILRSAEDEDSPAED